VLLLLGLGLLAFGVFVSAAVSQSRRHVAGGSAAASVPAPLQYHDVTGFVLETLAEVRAQEERAQEQAQEQARGRLDDDVRG
jgi:hypothetical protein